MACDNVSVYVILAAQDKKRSLDDLREFCDSLSGYVDSVTTSLDAPAGETIDTWVSRNMASSTYVILLCWTSDSWVLSRRDDYMNACELDVAHEHPQTVPLLMGTADESSIPYGFRRLYTVRGRGKLLEAIQR